MATKTDATTGAAGDLVPWLREQQQLARERRRQHPEALSALDDLVQRNFDPAIVFGADTIENRSEDEDDDEINGR